MARVGISKDRRLLEPSLLSRAVPLLLVALAASACSSPVEEDDDDSAPVADDDDSAGDDDDSSGDDDDSSGQPAFDWSDRVLVIYNANEPSSQAIAEHYVEARSLAASALCPTSPNSTDVIDAQEYRDSVALPVLECIAGDWSRPLVLVTTWGVPYRVTGAAWDIAQEGNLASASLDALLTQPHHQDELPLEPSWNPYYSEALSADGVYPTGMPIADWRESTGTTFYLVGRLDGPSPEIVHRMIDEALLFEESPPTGPAWVDRGWKERSDDVVASYASVEWDLTRLVQVFEAAGFETYLEETEVEVGTLPAPQKGEALYYGGWYSFNNYNDVWTWRPGAISLHFDSCSACNPRGGPNWSANVLERGALATMGAVAEPYVIGLMEYDQFYRHFFSGYSFIEAAYMATPVSEWMATYLGDPLYRPYGTEPLLLPDWQPPPLP